MVSHCAGPVWFHHLMAIPPHPIEDPRESSLLFEWLAADLASRGIEPLRESLYCSAESLEEIRSCRSRAYAAAGLDPDLPVSTVRMPPCEGGVFAGIWMFGVSDVTSPARCRSLADSDRLVGRQLDLPDGRMAFFTDLRVPGSRGIPQWIGLLLDHARRVLTEHDFTPSHVARTWLYLSSDQGRLSDVHEELARFATGAPSGASRARANHMTAVLTQPGTIHVEPALDMAVFDLPGPTGGSLVELSPRTKSGQTPHASSLDLGLHSLLHVWAVPPHPGLNEEGEIIATYQAARDLTAACGTFLEKTISGVLYFRDHEAWSRWSLLADRGAVPRLHTLKVFGELGPSPPALAIELCVIA